MNDPKAPLFDDFPSRINTCEFFSLRMGVDWEYTVSNNHLDKEIRNILVDMLMCKAEKLKKIEMAKVN